jgi:poly(hydroxyalkanoate) granule-associated protein
MGHQAKPAEELKVVHAITNSAHQIWLAGLGAFSKAQTEGTKLFESLVKEGEAVQARAAHVTGEQIAHVTKSAAGAWDKLSDVFEDRVAKSLNKLGVPTYGDIQTLTKQVNQLNESVQALLKSGKAGGATKAHKQAAHPHA